VPWLAWLHLASLSALAIAHPVLEVVGSSPSYFVALRGGRPEATALLVAAMLVPPALLGILLVVAGWISPRVARVVHVVLVASLVAALAVPPLHRAGLSRPHAIAILVGILAAVAYRRLAAVRDLASFLGVGLLVVPIVFAVSPAGEDLFVGAGAIVGATQARARLATKIERPLPIVLLLFDELPAGVLLDREGRINERRFPGFAQLARESTWYRDTTSPSDYTSFAVPALLTGRAVRGARAPKFEGYPDNLFALLSGRYRIVANEFWTDLRPRARSMGEERPPDRVATTLRALRDGLELVRRLIFPPPRQAPAPNLWANPWIDDYEAAPARFREFLDGLGADAEPTLHYCHLMVPHSPYQRLPTGQRYTNELISLAEEPEGPDPDDAVRLLQRAALSVGYADGLVQQLLARLRQTGLLDRAVVIVAADHGISFVPGALHRITTTATLDEIAPVPLFIRAPGSAAGRVVDAPLQLVDVVPTLADILGAELPAPVDGRVAERVDPAQPRARVLTNRKLEVFTFEDRGLVMRAARRYAAVIGAGPWEELWRVGPAPGLIFRDVASLRVVRRSASRVRWRTDADLVSADPRAAFVPAHLSVELQPPAAGMLVVALNGRVAATVAVSLARAGPRKVLLPPQLFRDGGNALQFLLADSPGASTFAAVEGEPLPPPPLPGR
jgi:hypothetical protein